MGSYTMEQYLYDINQEDYEKQIKQLKLNLPTSKEIQSSKSDCLFRVIGTTAISGVMCLSLTAIYNRHLQDIPAACLQMAPMGVGFLAISTLIAVTPYLLIKHKYNSSRREIDRLEAKLADIPNNKKHTK